MAVTTRKIHYQADGRAMTGDLYLDDAGGGRRPGVVVFSDALGIGKFSRGQAAKLAELGYVALACDLHGDGQRYTAETVGPVFAPVHDDAAKVLAVAQAGLDQLRAQPEVDLERLASVGYCFGGLMGLELARNGAPLKAVIGFHSVLSMTNSKDPANIKGKVLVCIGAEDAHITAKERAAFESEMRATKVDWRIYVYGGVLHSFTDPDAGDQGRPDFARYDPNAARRSWGGMRALLDEVFTAGG